MRDLIVYGGGYPDVVKLVQAINRHQPTWNLVGVIDDTMQAGATFMGLPLLGSRAKLPDLARSGAAWINNVCGSMQARRHVSAVLEQAGCPLATLIHPAVDTSYCEIGAGVLVSEGVVLGSRVRIGSHCAIRFRAIVNHDNTLEDHVFVGPGATTCGYVTLRSGAYTGAGSVIKERIQVGMDSIVGAGAVVIGDVPAGVTVAGVPAKVISVKRRMDENRF